MNFTLVYRWKTFFGPKRILHDLWRDAGDENLFIDVFLLSVIAVANIQRRINIIAVTTRNNLISDVHVVGVLAAQVVCCPDKHEFRALEKEPCCEPILRHIHSPKIYWFNWTLIDDVRNQIMKRHFVCYVFHILLSVWFFISLECFVSRSCCFTNRLQWRSTDGFMGENAFLDAQKGNVC